jgi:hypothetical protein
MIFLDGRIMVLGELLMSQSEWGLGSHSRGSSLGRLAIGSRFLTANPYSSRVHSTGPRGSLPFFEEKPWFGYNQDSNMVRDARGAQTPGYWPLASPSVATPHSSRCPGVVVEPVARPTCKLLNLIRP